MSLHPPVPSESIQTRLLIGGEWVDSLAGESLSKRSVRPPTRTFR